MVPGFRLIIEAMLLRDIAELRAIRDGAFTVAANTTGQGSLIASTVNGSSFQFSVPGHSTLSPMQVLSAVQLAIDHKMAGFCRPATKTTVRFI